LQRGVKMFGQHYSIIGSKLIEGCLT